MASEHVTIVLDAGALIAIERGSVSMVALADEIERAASMFVVPGPVLAQVWRGGSRQTLLSRFLNLPGVEVDVLTRTSWQRAGELCGATDTSDVVDAAVVVCARERAARAVVTSDPDDLRHLDADLVYWSP